MKICSSILSLNEALTPAVRENESLGFVPTMGALHAGHSSLVEQAIKSCDTVVCSIFVNPTQFNEKQDFNNYPKNIDADLSILKDVGCDIVFIPEEEEIYPSGNKTDLPRVDLGSLAEVMEGKHRPGHFDGVVQVVHRLFEIVKPDRAFFGEKDFQQLAIIRKMVDELLLPIEVIGCPIIRDDAGLALSSRNQLLTATGKSQALALFKVLRGLREQARTGTNALDIEDAFSQLLKCDGVEPEYLEVVDGHSLQPSKDSQGSDYVVACAAAWVEDVRLIDNMTLIRRG